MRISGSQATCDGEVNLLWRRRVATQQENYPTVQYENAFIYTTSHRCNVSCNRIFIAETWPCAKNVIDNISIDAIERSIVFKPHTLIAKMEYRNAWSYPPNGINHKPTNFKYSFIKNMLQTQRPGDSHAAKNDYMNA